MTEGFEYQFDDLDQPEKDPRPFRLRHRKALVYGVPAVLLVLFFVMCSGNRVLEKRSPIYRDLAANYDLVLVSEKGELQRLNWRSGRLKTVTAAQAGIAPVPEVPKKTPPKAGVVSASPDLQWSVVSKPYKEISLRQLVVNSASRTESPFGKNQSWKKVFWSPDSKYMFYLERAETGFFGMIGQVFSTGLMAEDDAREQVLVAIEPSTMRTCAIAETPDNHYVLVVKQKEPAAETP